MIFKIRCRRWAVEHLAEPDPSNASLDRGKVGSQGSLRADDSAVQPLARRSPHKAVGKLHASAEAFHGDEAKARLEQTPRRPLTATLPEIPESLISPCFRGDAGLAAPQRRAISVSSPCVLEIP